MTPWHVSTGSEVDEVEEGEERWRQEEREIRAARAGDHNAGGTRLRDVERGATMTPRGRQYHACIYDTTVKMTPAGDVGAALQMELAAKGAEKRKVARNRNPHSCQTTKTTNFAASNAMHTGVLQWNMYDIQWQTP